LKANLAVGYFGGPMDVPYIYLDSLLFQYTDQGLKLVYSMDGHRADHSQGFYFPIYLEGNYMESRDFDKPRFYMEYDIVVGDMTGTGQETAAVLLNAPMFPKNNYKTAFKWVNDLMNNSKPNNPSAANLPEAVMVRFLSINPDRYDSDNIQDGSFFAYDYNYFYKPGIRYDPKGEYNGQQLGLPLNRCASVVLCDTDEDTTYLSYAGQHEVIYSDPKVLAVLASTPYFKDLDRDDLSGSMMDSQTSYSSSQGSGSGSNDAVSFTLGAYVSGKFGGEVAWFEYETSLNFGFSYEWANRITKEDSVTYSTLAGQDTVVLYSIPVEVYYYNAYYPVKNSAGKIERYDKQTVTINFPHKPAVKTIALDKYKKLAKDYPALPVIGDDVLKSTPGDPFSYPKSTAGLKNAIVYSGDWAGVDYGNGSTTQEISITEEHEETYTHSVFIEFKLGGGGKHKLGETSGGIVGSIGGDFSRSTFTSVGSTYSGTIFDLPAEAEPYGYYFAWKLLTYTAEIDGVDVPVVTYLLTDVRRPPELPDDFAQDYSKTASDSIGLSWSYPAGKNIAGFQIYRYYDFPEGSGSYEEDYIDASKYTSVTYDDNGKPVYHYEYLDEELAPYTEYYYQIQAIRSAVPPYSILSKPMKARTKLGKGEPTITLNGVLRSLVPEYDTDGNLIGTKENYILQVYPDTASTVSVSVSEPINRTSKYQWQKKGEEGWTDIKGATSEQYRFTNSGYGQAGEYRCRVNYVYNDTENNAAYYITTYSDAFTVEYVMRQAQVISFAADDKSKTVSITLKSKHKNHFYAPTGTVTFRIEGKGYDQTFTAALKPNTENYTSTATLNLASTGEDEYGANLLTGAYRISAFYSGSRVFQALDVEEKVYYVVGNSDGYFLNLDKNSYYYGDPIKFELLHVYSAGENQVVVEPVTNGVEYKFYYKNPKNDPIWLEDPSFKIDDKNFASTRTGTILVEVYMNSVMVESCNFRVEPRPITIGFKGEFYKVYRNASPVEVDDVVVKEGNLAFGDTINNLNVKFTYCDNLGKEIAINNETLPGTYQVSVTSENAPNYAVTGESTNIYIMSTRYDLTIISEKLDGEIVGTVELVMPSSLKLDKGTAVTAATTNVSNQWHEASVIPGGTDLLFKASPQNGYRVVSWTVETPNVPPTTYMTDSNLFTFKTFASNTVVKVKFGYAQNKLYYASSSVGGSVFPKDSGIKSGSVVQPGASLTFLAEPAPGYHFVEWILSGNTKSNFKGTIDPDTGKYSTTITMGSKDTVLTGVFERDSYTLALSEGLVASYTTRDDTGNQVTKTDEGSITLRGDTEITVAPKPGYSAALGEWLVNGKSVGTGLGSYTFVLKENTTVQAPVTRGSYNVSLEISPKDADNKVKATANGIVTDFSGGKKISGGTKLVFTAQPARGYIFDHWKINGSEAGTDSVLTVPYLTQDISVEGVFVTDPVYHTVTITAGNNGSLEYTVRYLGEGNESSFKEKIDAGITVQLSVYSEDELSIIALPDDDYMLRSWMVNDEIIDKDTEIGVVDITVDYAQRVLSCSEITGDVNIKARFVPVSVTELNFSTSGVGLISASYDGKEITSGTLISNGRKLVLTAEPIHHPTVNPMVDYWTYNGEIIRNEDGTPFVGEVIEIDAFFGESTVDYEVFFTELVEHEIKIDVTDADVNYAASPSTYSRKTADSGNVHYARQGSKITLVVTPYEGYLLKLITVNGTQYQPDEDGIFRLTIPSLSEDLDITAYTTYLHIVSITPKDVSVVKGESLEFTATVWGIDNPPQDVIWSISGNTSNGTYIDSSGKLTVGEDETSTDLIIKATSVADPDASSEATVTVITLYTVSFNKNGGDTNANPEIMTVVAGESLKTLPQNPTRSGYTFEGWNTEADGRGMSFTENTPVLSDITVYAQWKKKSSNKGGSGGGTGSSSGDSNSSENGSSSDDITSPEDNIPALDGNEVIASDGTVTVISTIPSTVDENGKATAEVTNEQMNSAVTKAVTEAKQKDSKAIVEINVEAPADSETVEIVIPKIILESIVASGLEAFTISTSIADITFDRDALNTVACDEESNIVITVSRVNAENLSEEARKVIGDRPVFDLSVTSGDKVISQFGGYVTVTVPYTAKADEDINAIVIYHINGEGKLEVVKDCVYDPSTGTISFTTNQFSRYAVGYNKVSFKDVPENAWYSKAVTFVTARSIALGTGNGNFSSDEKLTRGQFIVMLMNAYGIAPDTDFQDNFADAGDTWYTGYLAAAKRLGISSGIGNNMFGPEKEISRQEMFTLLYNALKTLGRLPAASGEKSLSSFQDEGDVAPWAREAMTYFVKAGLVSGSNGKLLPNDSSTRAQMAQVLKNLFIK